ncbi:disrupted meiotic cDNA 1 [Tanacetum coccineum]
MLSRLTKIVEEFNIEVYMTNQVIADPCGGVFISDPKKQQEGMEEEEYVSMQNEKVKKANERKVYLQLYEAMEALVHICGSRL